MTQNHVPQERAVTVVTPRAGSLTDSKTYLPDYQEVVARATAQATVLMDIVEKRKLYTVQRGGKKFLHFEAWQLVGAFDGAGVATEHTTAIEERGEVIGYLSKVNVLKDGVVIASAEATCFLDESVAEGRKTASGKKQAAISMSQTRAASKALRMKYSAVAVLAGFQPTPAEEMTDDDEPLRSQQSPQQQRPAAQQQQRPQTQQRPAPPQQQGQVIEGDFTPAPEEPRPPVQKAATPLEGWLTFLDTLTDQQRQTWVDAQLQHMGGLSFAECGENEQRNFLEWVRQTVRAGQGAKA